MGNVGSATSASVLVRPLLVTRIVNRRTANWALENAPWTPAKAAGLMRSQVAR